MNKQKLLTVIKRNRSTVFLIALCLAGILLFAVGDTGKKEKQTVKEGEEALQLLLQEKTARELEKLILLVEGVSDARVYISFDTTRENVYAKNEENRENYQSSEYVIVDNNGENGLLLSSLCPKARGVAAVCAYSGGAKTKEEITRLLSAALGIASNKIYVGTMTK